MILSIIIPAHNEEENIEQIIKKVEDSLDIPFELIIVNDHCVDKTKEIVARASSNFSNIKLVDNMLEKGFANAVKAGFKSSSGQVIIPVMADSCDDLSTIKVMLGKINQGFDVVCGSRYTPGGSRIGGSTVKGFLSCYAGKSLRCLLGFPTCDITNAFKMYKREVLEAIDIRARGFEISMELPLKAHFARFKITEVPTLWKERTKGKSSFKILKLLPAYIKLYLWAVKKRIFG